MLNLCGYLKMSKYNGNVFIQDRKLYNLVFKISKIYISKNLIFQSGQLATTILIFRWEDEQS